MAEGASRRPPAATVPALGGLLSVSELENRFRHHPPGNAATVEAHEHVRQVLYGVARELLDVCPPGRELSSTITHLEEAMFWANAAIARHGR